MRLRLSPSLLPVFFIFLFGQKVIALSFIIHPSPPLYLIVVIWPCSNPSRRTILGSFDDLKSGSLQAWFVAFCSFKTPTRHALLRGSHAPTSRSHSPARESHTPPCVLRATARSSPPCSLFKLLRVCFVVVFLLIFYTFHFMLLFFLFFVGYYLSTMMLFDLEDEIFVDGGRLSTAPIWLSTILSLQQSLKGGCCLYCLGLL